MTIAESVRANTALEARYRVDTPNSRPRNAVLIGLDEPSRVLVAAMAARRPERRIAFDIDCDGGAMDRWLRELPARTQALTDAVDAANIVIVVAAAGTEAPSASVIADACRARGVRMTALVVNASVQSDAAIAVTLAHLRPGAAMVVVANDDAYVEDMLNALQA